MTDKEIQEYKAQQYAKFEAYGNDDGSVEFVWSVEDVWEIDSTLHHQEARVILGMAKDGHDASIGMNWEVLEHWVDYFKSEYK